MNAATWAKMPCTWQGDAWMHDLLRMADQGEAIAALKLYIALCLKANFKPKQSLPATGCVKRSITQLCALTGLSRPMVIKGLRYLEEWDIIKKLDGRPAIYQLIDYETCTYWAKLPRSHLFGDDEKEKCVERLTLLSNRSRVTLDALQLYLYIASIRDRRTMKAKVTYSKIMNTLGLQRNDISAAITVLTAHRLMSSRLGEVDEHSTGEHPCNTYWLIGPMSDNHPS